MSGRGSYHQCSSAPAFSHSMNAPRRSYAESARSAQTAVRIRSSPFPAPLLATVSLPAGEGGDCPFVLRTGHAHFTVGVDSTYGELACSVWFDERSQRLPQAGDLGLGSLCAP